MERSGESGKVALNVQENEGYLTKCEMKFRLIAVIKRDCNRCEAVNLLIICVQG